MGGRGEGYIPSASWVIGRVSPSPLPPLIDAHTNPLSPFPPLPPLPLPPSSQSGVYMVTPDFPGGAFLRKDLKDQYYG